MTVVITCTKERNGSGILTLLRKLARAYLRWCDENEDRHTGDLGRRRTERRKAERRAS
jgi:hypothetical protein